MKYQKLYIIIIDNRHNKKKNLSMHHHIIYYIRVYYAFMRFGKFKSIFNTHIDKIIILYYNNIIISSKLILIRVTKLSTVKVHDSLFKIVKISPK